MQEMIAQDRDTDNGIRLSRSRSWVELRGIQNPMSVHVLHTRAQDLAEYLDLENAPERFKVIGPDTMQTALIVWQEDDGTSLWRIFRADSGRTGTLVILDNETTGKIYDFLIGTVDR